MPITITCPHCGQRLKAPDAAVGKKAKCKGCGGPITIAAPRPAKVAPKPRELEPLDDIYGLSDDDPYDSELASSGDGATAPFAPGDSFEIFAVDECSDDRLVLRARALKLGWWALTGLAAFVAGLVTLRWLEYQALHVRGSMRIPVFVILIPSVMLWYGVYKAVLLAKLGEQVTFDRGSRTVTQRRLYLFDRSWKSDEVGSLVYVVGKPGRLNAQDPEQGQFCELFVVDPAGRSLAQLGGAIKATWKSTLLDAARALVHAGRVLGVPVSVELLAPPATEAVHQAVLLVGQSSSPRQTAFRKPWITVVNIGTFLGSVVFLAACLHFMYIWHFYFGTSR